MHFDPHNHVVKLCAQAMEAEGAENAVRLFEQAWNAATNDFEKCIAAHYFTGREGNQRELKSS